jgi:Spy/CpxP family protein refolding chaperone
VVLVLSFLVGVLAGVRLERTVLRPGGWRDGGPRGGAFAWLLGRGEPPRRREQMARDLGLTPQQSRAIDSILAQQSRRLEVVRQESRPRMEAIVDSTRQRIDSLLTPDQRARMQELRSQHEDRRHRRWEP